MYYHPAVLPVFPAQFCVAAASALSVYHQKTATDSEGEFRAVGVVAPLEGLKFETSPIQRAN